MCLCGVEEKEFGKELARDFPVEADLVCGVPDSGNEAAQGYAEESGIPYSAVFVKNKYIGEIDGGTLVLNIEDKRYEDEIISSLI